MASYAYENGRDSLHRIVRVVAHLSDGDVWQKADVVVKRDSGS